MNTDENSAVLFTRPTPVMAEVNRLDAYLDGYYDGDYCAILHVLMRKNNVYDGLNVDDMDDDTLLNVRTLMRNHVLENVANPVEEALMYRETLEAWILNACTIPVTFIREAFDQCTAIGARYEHVEKFVTFLLDTRLFRIHEYDTRGAHNIYRRDFIESVRNGNMFLFSRILLKYMPIDIGDASIVPIIENGYTEMFIALYTSKYKFGHIAALFCACQFGRIDIIKYLLDNIIDSVYFRGIHARKCVETAFRHNKYSSVKFLIHYFLHANELGYHDIQYEYSVFLVYATNIKDESLIHELEQKGANVYEAVWYSIDNNVDYN